MNHSTMSRPYRLWLLIAVFQLIVGMTGCDAEPQMLRPTQAIITLPTATPRPTQEPTPVFLAPPDFSLCWVAYSPTVYDPDIPRFPLPSELRDDLAALHTAGFQGIITYSSRDIMAEIPALAKEIGFQQVIQGVWDPQDEREIADAITAAPFVDGYIIGNEGLANESYSLDELRASLKRVRDATEKPVTTTERLEMYYGSSDLIMLGDWLAPIAHPYWHQFVTPAEAAEWTAMQFTDLQAATLPGRAIQFKELGLPTDGDPRISETAQMEYYSFLWDLQDPLRFAYFEGFDQAWKAASSGVPVESNWGLFRADRSPKPVADIVCGKTPALPTLTPEPSATPTIESSPVPPPSPTTAALATVVPTPSFVVRTLFGDSLAPDLEINIDNSSHQFGWLSVGNTLQADFLGGQQWATVYMTYGQPQPLGQRSEYTDLSACQALLVDLWAAQPGVEVKVGVKDIDDPDNGAEALVSRVLTQTPLVYRIPLDQLVTADLTRIYLPFEVVYHSNEAATVFIDNVRLECQQ